MVGLSKRWIRQLVYLTLVSSSIVLLLLFANKHNVIDINAYLPKDYTPTFFQPPSDSYIIDIEINSCYRYSGKPCEKPRPSAGRLGDLKNGGGWLQIDKDLSLKNSFFKQYYFNYKKVKSEVLVGRVIGDAKVSKKSEITTQDSDKRVVVDIAVENREIDSMFAHNKLNLPKYIIEQYNVGKSFNDDDHQELLKSAPKAAPKELVEEKVHNPKENPKDLEDEKVEAQNPEDLDEKVEVDEEENEKEKDGGDDKSIDKSKQSEDGSKNEESKEESKKPNEKPDEKINEAESLLAQAESKDNEADAEAKALLEHGIKVDAKDPTDSKNHEAEALKKAENEGNDKESEAEALKKEAEGKHQESEAEALKKAAGKDKRAPISRHELKVQMYIPSKEQVVKDGWIKKSNGIWLKYGKANEDAVTAIDIVFGEDCVDPRPNWKLIKDGPIHVSTAADKKAYLTFRKGPRLDYKASYGKNLKFNENGNFKILQVADLHFSTGFGQCRDPSPPETKKGCQADPRTLKFVNKVLDIEKPDFVVLTGDQIFGDAAPDSETALFKALNPFVSRQIPFAVTLGNHDDEGSLNRQEIMELSSQIPFSMAILGPETIDGFGNYMLTVESRKKKNPGMALYFLDSHKYSSNPKAFPGYDWIKDSQKRYLAEEYEVLKSKVSKYTDKFLSMAFFHIPLPEYRNTGQAMVGPLREGVTAPRKNSGVRDLFSQMDVKVVSVGHDHCNEYCLRDTPEGQEPDADDSDNIWLCYGGGVGEGGYAGYGDYIRKLRIFEINEQDGRISSWKRAENDPDNAFDAQQLVNDGIAR